MAFIDTIIERAKADKKTIVLLLGVVYYLSK